MDGIILKYDINTILYLNEDLRKYITDMNKLYETLKQIWEYMKVVCNYIENEIYKEVVSKDINDILRLEHKTRIKNLIENLMLNYIQYLIINNIYFEAPENLVIDYIKEIELEENIKIPSFEELTNKEKIYSVIYYSVNGLLNAVDNYKRMYKPVICPDIFNLYMQVVYQ